MTTHAALAQRDLGIYLGATALANERLTLEVAKVLDEPRHHGVGGARAADAERGVNLRGAASHLSGQLSELGAREVRPRDARVQLAIKIIARHAQAHVHAQQAHMRRAQVVISGLIAHERRLNRRLRDQRDDALLRGDARQRRERRAINAH